MREEGEGGGTKLGVEAGHKSREEGRGGEEIEEEEGAGEGEGDERDGRESKERG